MRQCRHPGEQLRLDEELLFLDFTRDVGKLITVNYMMAKDSVKKRLSGENQQGMSFTEFSYQLLQGYDYLHLYRTYGCRLQLGGSDQWGNITTGTELIRRTEGGEAYALTCPLITKADGSKFGKNRERKCVARPPLHFAFQVLPVLAQCFRRGRSPLHQDFHRTSRRRDPRAGSPAAGRPGKRPCSDVWPRK